MFRNQTSKNARTRLRGFEGLESRELLAADLFAADSLAPVEEDPAMVVGPLDDTDLGDVTGSVNVLPTLNGLKSISDPIFDPDSLGIPGPD